MSEGILRVRPGLARDATALRAIRLEALADSPDAYGETYDECAAWAETTWEQKAREWNFYVAEFDGRVVGMARGESHDADATRQFLFAMYVSPSARGTDAAPRLVDAVSAWARAQGADALHLYVSAAVPRARAFYLKSGFLVTGDALTMHRDESLVCEEMRRDLADFAFAVREVAPPQLHDLRRRVLRDDDPAVDVRNRDDDADSSVHFGGFLGPRAVVSASFFAVASPQRPGEPAYQLRYMATDFDVQGRGLGARLLEEALAALSRRGVRQVWANARITAVPFYQRSGWDVVPNSLFVSSETGIDHVVIERSLPPSPASVD